MTTKNNLSEEEREARRQQIMAALLNAREINPYTYDASYEMVRKAAEVYARDFPKDVGFPDYDLFINLVVDVRNEVKRGLINKTNLNDSAKEELCRALYNTDYKSYTYEAPKEAFGLFSHTASTGERGDRGLRPEDAKKIVALIASLAAVQNANLKLQLVGEAFESPIHGFKNGTASQILHCLDPELFPILNGHKKDACVYWVLGVVGIPGSSEKRNDLTQYVKYCEAIRDFRNNHFSFKNYRVFDEFEERFPDVQ